jgi:hypothetical protein
VSASWMVLTCITQAKRGNVWDNVKLAALGLLLSILLTAAILGPLLWLMRR